VAGLLREETGIQFLSAEISDKGTCTGITVERKTDMDVFSQLKNNEKSIQLKGILFKHLSIFKYLEEGF